jgi:ribosomal subunit interface protein
MDLTIKGHDVEVTESLRGRVEGVLQQIERQFDQIVSAVVSLGLETRKKREDRQRITFTLFLKGRRKIVVSKADFDMHYAISNAAHALGQTVKRLINKMFRPDRQERRWKRNPDALMPVIAGSDQR